MTENTGLRRSAPLRILVVDDNRDLAESFAKLLRIIGHEVLTAYDGRNLVESAVAFLPDVVFLDIGLPGMDGYAVADQLRTHPALGRAALVALTGYSTPSDQRDSRQTGFFAHFVKPVQFSEVQKFLNRISAKMTETDPSAEMPVAEQTPTSTQS
jgi:CheY-like chemotaxis protein